MEKNTKKRIIFTLGIILIIIAVIALVLVKPNNNEEFNENYYTFPDNGNVASEGMEPINTTIKLGAVLQNVRDEKVNKLEAIEDSKANELLNLREYVGLEKMVAQYIDDESFTEIWLLKISEDAQAPNIFRIYNERIADLKNEYKDNAKISAILADENNIRIKQQSGIVIIVVSNDAENIEKAIDENFITFGDVL